MFRLRFWLPVWLLLSGALGVRGEAETNRLRVLTSIPPLYSWAANVVGDLAEVENLLPADIGPHDFQLRPKDLQRIQQADVILINGLGLESWLTKPIRDNARQAKRRVVEVAAGLGRSELIYALPELSLGGRTTAHAHDHGDGANPHLWLDPVFARHGVTNLLAALCEADPANAEAYTRNAGAYLAKLTQLDDEIRVEIRKLLHRQVVTFHDAFPYFCRRYGLELVGVIEEVPGASPSPRYLASLSKAIRDRGVKVVFTEPQFNPRLAQQLARDLGISVARLDVLETGPLNPTAYEEGMRRNLKALMEALK